MAEVIQTRPFWSIIGLSGFAGSFQINSSPQNRDGAGMDLAIIPGTVSGSTRRGIFKLVARWVSGSSIASSSLEMFTP